MTQLRFPGALVQVPPDATIVERARLFCDTAPHRQEPFARRNWGGRLHSLCSYQGKLKPSIAYFLIDWFTKPGDRVLDPMAGVGTIPLEARRQNRKAIANDLSPLADCVSRAKVAHIDPDGVVSVSEDLGRFINSGSPLDELTSKFDVTFGLNGKIEDYFHPDTLREVLLARQFFLEFDTDLPAAERDVVRSSVLHILHGNRPYALSRRSHPVTPFAPTGAAEYRPVMGRLVQRLTHIVPLLIELDEVGPAGEAHNVDFRDLALDPVDAVITSPPFAKSLRFWSMNWMRLWFMGWDAADFKVEPSKFLETQQKSTFEPYRDFSLSMHRLMKPGGLLIMHLGATPSVNMAEQIVPLIEPEFETAFVGTECVRDTESHGLRDKGITMAHLYLFAVRR